MFTCLEEQNLDENALSFKKASIQMFVKVLCVGELNEKEYIKEFNKPLLF